MILRAEGLALTLSRRMLWAGLSASLGPGECWAVLGPNGAGKTSLLHALAGLRAPSAGVVSLDGRALAGLPRAQVARHIGLLPQEASSEFWGTVLDWVRLGRYPHGAADEVAQAHAALRRVGMEEFAARPLRSLSGGERQRVRLALLLAQSPQIYLLDEPLHSLDLRHQAQVRGLIRALVRAGHTVVLTLHEPADALALASRAILLDGAGGVAVGEAGNLLTAERLSRLYRWPLAQVEIDGRAHFVPRTEVDYSEFQ